MRQIKFRAWHLDEKIMLGHDDACKTPIFTNSWMYRSGDVALMQFTGLKDKNGVEIYEGDIVKMSDDGEIAETKFHSGAFRFIGNNISWNYYRDSCEVIGNIHQHPELLESDR